MFHQVWTSQSCGKWICKDYERQALSLLSHQSGRLATTIPVDCKTILEMHIGVSHMLSVTKGHRDKLG